MFFPSVLGKSCFQGDWWKGFEVWGMGRNFLEAMEKRINGNGKSQQSGDWVQVPVFPSTSLSFWTSHFRCWILRCIMQTPPSGLKNSSPHCWKQSQKIASNISLSRDCPSWKVPFNQGRLTPSGWSMKSLVFLLQIRTILTGHFSSRGPPIVPTEAFVKNASHLNFSLCPCLLSSFLLHRGRSQEHFLLQSCSLVCTSKSHSWEI